MYIWSYCLYCLGGQADADTAGGAGACGRASEAPMRPVLYPALSVGKWGARKSCFLLLCTELFKGVESKPKNWCAVTSRT